MAGEIGWQRNILRQFTLLRRRIWLSEISARKNPGIASDATPGFKWRGPDLNRRPRGYEAPSKSRQKPLKTSASANVLTLLRFCNSKRFFSMIISFLHFRLSQKGNWKVDPMCPQEVPNSCRQQPQFERSLNVPLFPVQVATIDTVLEPPETSSFLRSAQSRACRSDSPMPR